MAGPPAHARATGSAAEKRNACVSASRGVTAGSGSGCGWTRSSLAATARGRAGGYSPFVPDVGRKRLACLGVRVAVSSATLAGPPKHRRSPRPSAARTTARRPACRGRCRCRTARAAARAEGYTCNLTEVGFMPSSSFANFDTYENCAYYSDTIGAFNAEGGTVVVDVSDPRKPVQTAYLTERAAANAGRVAARAPRSGACSSPTATSSRRASSNADDPDANRALAIYDISKDCRKPKLLADVVMPSAVGHEGCFQADGMVYYMASTDTITPIDISDPTKPEAAVGAAEPRDPRLLDQRGRQARLPRRHRHRRGCSIADTSEVQARKQNAADQGDRRAADAGQRRPAVDDPDLLRRPPAHLQLLRVRRARAARARRGPTARRTSATR